MRFGINAPFHILIVVNIWVTRAAGLDSIFEQEQ